MEDLAAVLSDFATQCRQTLGADGPLSATFQDFEARAPQISLAEAVADAIDTQLPLVVEAGTGTGKTWAYLIPCLLSGKKTIISTATKTLQDQLFYKDLPKLLDALALPRKIQNLRGRDNYICLHRLEENVKDGRFQDEATLRDVLTVYEAQPRLTSGEKHELPEIAENASVWPYVTATKDQCLGSECSFYKKCFLVKARQRALQSDIILINHHLFFADSRLKSDGFGELLPGVDIVVFDEAHQLEEIATHFYGERLSTLQLLDWLDDTINERDQLDAVTKRLASFRLELNDIVHQLHGAVPDNFGPRMWLQQAFKNPVFMNTWERLEHLIEELEDCFEPGEEKARFIHLKELLNTFSQRGHDTVCWLEKFKRSVVFYATPVSVSSVFKQLIKRNPCTYVFTSATLSVSGSFNCFQQALGLEEATSLQLESTFDFQTQALLYLPRGMPDPKADDYYDALLKATLPIIEACQGRCFFLFTSHRGLQTVATALKELTDYPLLIQGDEAKSILLNRFRETGNAILLGTATFWEGVDVKGDALSCVIIDKLPFANPSDPLMEGKLAHLKSQGRSGFDELTLPQAILALKQGVGRLIRDTKDKGILMIADPRLVGRYYSEAIFASLPPMPKTRNQQKALDFIHAWETEEGVVV